MTGKILVFNEVYCTNILTAQEYSADTKRVVSDFLCKPQTIESGIESLRCLI
jgi:hypothetical protein